MPDKSDAMITLQEDEADDEHKDADITNDVDTDMETELRLIWCSQCTDAASVTSLASHPGPGPALQHGHRSVVL